MSPEDHLAVLIDADNAPPSRVDQLFEAIAKYGTPSVRRVYGDWTSTQLKGWKSKLPEYAIQPMQQFAHTSGKNSTDSAMIIDAMDLLYTGKFTGFCLVTSDSDFTRLASRIRENGLDVLGFGQRKTPQPFIRACTEFVYIDDPEDEKPASGRKKTGGKQAEASNPQKAGVARFKGSAGLIKSVRTAIAETSDDDEGWAILGPVGSRVKNAHPDFVPGNFGFAKLSSLLEATKLFELSKVDKKVMIRDPKA